MTTMAGPSRRRHRHRRRAATSASCLLAASAALLVLLLAAPPRPARADLVMVYSIQRHGARNVLPKSSVLAESEAAGGPALLPQGRRQCRAAGRAFAARYVECGGGGRKSKSNNNSTTCLTPAGADGWAYGVVGTPGVAFSNWNTFANSSALDRALASSGAFLSGVFPASTAAGASASSSSSSTDPPTVVPVFTVAESEDWKIRGYTRCPEYAARLERWLASDEFRAKERESAALRARVGGLVPQLNSSLANWWNVYDAFNVWRQYGVGDPTPPLDNATFAQTVDLAHWLETRKMQPSLTGGLLGGAALGDLLSRAASAESAVRSGGAAAGYYRLLTVSAHYNTQLGVLSALQAGAEAAGQTQTAYAWRERIPALAAVLAFELHHDNNNNNDLFAVRAVAQDGPSAPYAALPLPCAQQGDAAERLAGPGACTLARFRALAGPLALNSSRDWCQACGNRKVVACRAAAMERQLAAAGLSIDDGLVGAPPSATTRYSSPGMVALWCAVSVAAAALLSVAAFFAARAIRQQRRKSGDGGNVGGSSCLRPSVVVVPAAPASPGIDERPFMEPAGARSNESQI